MKHEDYATHKEVDDSSFFKWLLGLGIPLLLIGAYLFNTSMDEQVVTPTITNQQVMAESPTDRVISEGLRSAFLSRGDIVVQNVVISAHDGVVTLSGSVPNVETRNYIDTAAKNFPGVTQVVDKLEIK